jgi:hypothetical protein
MEYAPALARGFFALAAAYTLGALVQTARDFVALWRQLHSEPNDTQGEGAGNGQ